MHLILRKLALAVLATCLPHASGEESVASGAAVLKDGDTIPQSTLSPDGRFGVTVPDAKRYGDASERWQKTGSQVYLNKLVAVKTGRCLAVIKGENGMERMNHGGLAPHWTKDGSALLWVVGGKWFPRAAVYLRLEDGRVLWQTDLLGRAQQEMLRRTRAAVPDAFAAAVRENKGNGSAFPQGFAIDIVLPTDNPGLPLRFSVDLASEPRNMESFPLKAEIYAIMTGSLESDGTVKWSGFQVWTGAEARRRKADAE